MNLQDLLTRHAWRPDHGVPDWMLGWFKRYSISFADGLTDVQTHVCWLQSRNFTIDLRLPRRCDQASTAQGTALTQGRHADIHAASWSRWADFEGWKAPATWDGTRLTWHQPDAILQWHDRWPEPAILHRVGQCMIEFCDSGAYVEDWRLQPSAPGPLIGLHLLCEQDALTGEVTHTGGGWIICGDHAALVLGHPRPNVIRQQGMMLRDRVTELLAQDRQAPDQLAALFDFETSVATWNGRQHNVLWSTRPDRVGHLLCPTDGLSWVGDAGQSPDLPVSVPAHLAHLPRVRQTLEIHGREMLRHYVVDTLEPELTWGLSTPCTESGRTWMRREAQTLGRYTEVLSDAHADPLSLATS